MILLLLLLLLSLINLIISFNVECAIQGATGCCGLCVSTPCSMTFASSVTTIGKITLLSY